MKLKVLTLSFLALVGTLTVNADEFKLKDGDKIAIIGDSITEQKIYTRIIETYLRLCSGFKNIRTFQYGWGGERAPGGARRVENDVIQWNPTVATILYGMNDGSYQAYNEEKIGVPYRKSMTELVQKLKNAKVSVIVGTPPVVDSFTYAAKRKEPDIAKIYNENLKTLGEIGKEIAKNEGEYYADVNALMFDTMEKAKKELGEKYHVAGGDGVHPSGNGQFLIAFGFLNAMNLDAKIASITMDMDGKTTVSDGHAVISEKSGSVEIESTRYPFCFWNTNMKDPNNMYSIIPFCDFQEKLNRFELKVTGLTAPKAEIAWGNTKRTFTAEQLKNGINLAAEFIENPFSKQFKAFFDATGKKHSFETTAVKGFITHVSNPATYSDDKNVQDKLTKIKRDLFEIQSDISNKLNKLHVPIKHVITVTQLND